MKFFISYARADYEEAVHMERLLRLLGCEVWMDLTRMRGGETFVNEIYSNIAQSDFFVVLLTKNTTASRWVNAEILFAVQKNIAGNSLKIIPIIVSDCEPPDMLKSYNIIDLRTNRLLGLSSIAKIILPISIEKAKNEYIINSYEEIENLYETFMNIQDCVCQNSGIPVTYLLRALHLCNWKENSDPMHCIDGEWSVAFGWGMNTLLTCTLEPHELRWGWGTATHAHCSFDKRPNLGTINEVSTVGDNVLLYKWQQHVSADMGGAINDCGSGYWLLDDSCQMLHGLWWYNEDFSNAPHSGDVRGHAYYWRLLKRSI